MNDAGYVPTTGISIVPERREATVVTVEATSAQVSDYGALGFFGEPDQQGKGGLIEVFARGHWTRYRRVQ
jgi:hypothetical protein